MGDFYSNSVAEDYQEGAGGLQAFDPSGRRWERLLGGAACLPKVGYILAMQEEEQLFIFSEVQRKSFDLNLWHLEHVLNEAGFKDCGLSTWEVDLK